MIDGTTARYYISGTHVTVGPPDAAKSAKAGETMRLCTFRGGRTQYLRERYLQPVKA